MVNVGSVGSLLTAVHLNFGGGGFPNPQPPGPNQPGGPTVGNPGGTTTTVPGSNSGVPGIGTGSTGGGSTGGSAQPPIVSNPQNTQAAGFAEDLSGVSRRLKFLFPAFLLAIVGILAGRFGRAPARLPRA
jgi:hypothetical protein